MTGKYDPVFKIRWMKRS